jgi:multisubunit Na+/H+ antiporter MnhB subunit
MPSPNAMMRCKPLIAVIFMSLAIKLASAEDAPPASGVSMSATLIGAISFIMCLYYFINYPDEDIQQKSWETISSTISIFCAVLLFSAVNDMVEAYIIVPRYGEAEGVGALCVDVIHMLTWFAIMQLSLAWFSGAAGPWAVDTEAYEALPEDEQEKVKEDKEVNMSCFAVLLAHISGFASINAFGTMQAVFFSSSPYMALMTVPVAFLCMQLLQRLTDTIREWVSMGDDGEKDEFEELWDDETEEAENDVMGLALSFTLISALRFMYTGCLPNSEGKEEECDVEEFLFHHTGMQKIKVLGTAGIFAALLFIIRITWPECIEKKEIEKIEDESKQKRFELLARTCEGLFVAVSMAFSWSFFYGTQMWLAGFHFFRGQEELLSVSLAMVISIPMMFGLIPLDKLADMDFTGPKCDMAIRSLMEAMALLIGFAWEQCFDQSVDTLAAVAPDCNVPGLNIHTAKLGLSIFCASLLVPAWKWYILPFMVNKGWKFGVAWNFEQLENALIRMVEVDSEEEEEEGEEGEETEKATDHKKIKKMIHVFEKVHRNGSSRLKPGQSTGLKVEVYHEDGEAYKALPSDDLEACKAKNAILLKELGKAKATSLQAQRQLDAALENMMASMKYINMTEKRMNESMVTVAKG